MKKIKRIILHIGTRKTGSKTIQRMLQSAKSEVHEQGVDFLKPGPGRALKDVFVSIQASTNDWRDQIESQCRRARRKGLETFVFSSEDLYYLREERAKDLIDFCQSIADQVQVVLFLRRQDNYIESSYTQYTRAGIWIGNIQTDFLSFLGPCMNDLNYLGRCKFWAQLIGEKNLRVFPYVSGDTAEMFLHELGLVIENEQHKEVKNERPSIDLLRVLIFSGEALADHFNLERHCFNDLNKHCDFRGNVRNRLASAFEVAGLSGGKYTFLTSEHLAKVEEEFSADNAMLVDQFGGMVGSEFSQFEWQPDTFQELGLEEVSAEAIRISMAGLLEVVAGMETRN